MMQQHLSPPPPDHGPDKPSQSPRFALKRSSALGTIALIALTLLALGRVVTHEFSDYDDVFTIHRNPALNPPTFRTLAHYWTTPAYGLYVPLTYTVWTAIAFVGYGEPDAAGIRLNPALFHAASLIVHLASVLLVRAILRRLFRDDLCALLGAAVFAVHPLQVETVSWTSGLKDLLAGALGLAAIHAHLRARDALAGECAPSRFSMSTLVPPLLLLLAMLAKPSAMVVPAIVIVMDWLIRGRDLRKALLAAVPMVLVALPLMIVARLVQDVSDVPSIAIWQRPFVAGDSITFYLWKLIWPVGLGIDYGRTPQVAWESPAILIAWIAPVAAIFAGYYLLRSRAFAAGMVMFIAALLPTSGLAVTLFQMFSTVADHYAYLAMFGIAVTVAGIVVSAPRRWPTIVIAVLVCVLTLRSFDQARHWKNSLTLFSRATHVNPASFLGWNNLGDALARRGEMELAKRAFERALQANPRWYVSLDNLAYVQHQMSDTAAAIQSLRRAVEVRRDLSAGNRTRLLPDALQRLGALLLDAGHADEAVAPLREALELRPDDAALRELLSIAQSRASTRPRE